MQSVEKTFRYSYIFKNLGVIYLLFLGIGSWLILTFDGHLFFLFMLLGIGVLAIIIYVTTSVTISDKEIAGRTMLGSRTLKWLEIGTIRSTNSSFKLINTDGDISIRINSRLDGYAEIFNLLNRKRSDLFEYDKHNPFSRSVIGSIATVTIQLFLLIISIINLIFNKEEFGRYALFIGVGISSIYFLFNWFFSPQSITMKSNSLTIKYVHKTDLYSKDNIGSLSFRKGAATLNLKGNKNVTFSLSGFAQSPAVVYYVLQRWYQDSLAKPTVSSIA